MFGGFNVNKLKPNLKMAVNRIAIVKNKKVNAINVQKKEVAELLGSGKEEKARIRVEGIIRDDFTLEAYEILELLCELLSERAALIKAEQECPYDMREAVCTLIWAANRTQIPELNEVRKQLTKRYGQDFAAGALRNADGCVNERVIHKLGIQPPNAYLVINYMKEIAKQNNVNWEPDESAVADPLAPMAAPTGVSVRQGPASGPEFATIYNEKPGNVHHSSELDWSRPPSASLHTPPTGRQPSPSTGLPSSSGHESHLIQQRDDNPPRIEELGKQTQDENDDIPDFDELSARFEKLRRRS